VAASRDLFGRYFKIVRSAFSSDGTVGGGGGDAALLPAKGLMLALATMLADLSGIHRMLPEAMLGDRASEVVERAVRSRVGALYHVPINLKGPWFRVTSRANQPKMNLA
jgi:hypothetical protein